MLGLVALILATQYPSLAAIRLRAWFGMVILLAASLVVGLICGGRDRAARAALAVTTGQRNAALALMIATANFAGTPAVTAVTAYALASLLVTRLFAVLLGRSAASASPKSSP